MSCTTEGIHTINKFHRREMELMERAACADVKLAIPAALHYCAEHGLVVPDWLTKAALELLCDLLTRERVTKRGRSGAIVARHHQHMIDFIRWNQVLCIREKQVLARESMSWIEKNYRNSDCPAVAEEKARANWLGRTLDRAFECTSEMLERTEAFGSAGSMRRSYRAVEHNNADPTAALRYCQFHPLLLQMLGIADDLGYAHGAKITPWHTRRPKRKNDPSAAALRRHIAAERSRMRNVSRETHRDYRSS